MIAIPVFVYVVLGLLVGSFLNVCVLRFNTGKTLLGRSGCLACQKQLHWTELIPVISWLALRRRCSGCGVRISLQYPLVELSTAVAFGVIGGAAISMVHTLLAFVIVALLILIAVYDFKHTIIPDVWVYAFSAVSLLTSLLFLDAGITLFVAGPILALPFAALWYLSNGAWMGLGDAKLTLGIGWLLGLFDGFQAVMSAFVLGAVISVFILIPLPYIKRVIASLGITQLKGGAPRLTMKSEIPFGPFLITAALLLWFTKLYGIQLAPVTLLGALVL